MEQTRSNTRKILIWNKVYPHWTPPPIAVDSYSGSNRPQEDNAGPLPASGTSLLVTTARLLRTTLSLSTPVETSPAPSPPVSFSVPTTQSSFVHKGWKHHHDNQARPVLTLSQSLRRSSLRSSP